MENYTKYRMKDSQELLALLEGKDNLFVVACNKCFKEFEADNEPDLEAFLHLTAGKNITGTAKVDFLCNKVQTARKLMDAIPEGTEHVVVLSCGLGIQTMASIQELNVIAAANSLNYTGHHGMALTKFACDACDQCYLNVTGGSCPIVDCSKSLLNGQCGGAKDGKCEVSPDKDCAWEKIYRKLEAQGRLEEFQAQSVQLRDYSKVNVKKTQEYVKAIRESRFAGYYGGVHPEEHKEFSEHIDLVRFPAPETVVIPMSMHLGAPANPIVAVGDTVQVGQRIGEPSAFISAPVHSSVSGTVVAIEERPHATRGTCLSVVIRSDGKNTVHESVQGHNLEDLTADEIVEIVRQAGIVGMGGAGFPTAVKLKPNKPIEYVLLNGCECEPYLTADHQVLLHFADDVLYGLRAMMKAVGAPKGVIVIEDNKPDAIALMQSKVSGLEGIEVVAAKTKYPQGAEKMLIKRVTGKMVPSGGLPADVGCVVGNISTTKAVADAIRTGMPLIERVASITGEHIAHPGNFLVKIGTNVADMVAYCGGITGSDVTVKAGGPMMGFPLSDLNVPVMKGSNGIIAIETNHSEPVECIKCGRCVDVCPMDLEPLHFAKLVMEPQKLKDRRIMDCMECRCCEYICSSKIPLVNLIKIGKNAVRGMK